MIANLGLYDHPSQQDANDRLWAAIRAHLDEGPQHLTRDGTLMEMWTSHALVLGQTCGLPYRAALVGRVTRIGTPDYALAGCPPGYYRSLMLRRKGDNDAPLRVFAYNDGLSHSGWAGPSAWLATRGIQPAQFLETGAHAVSARAVADGQADLCGIDARTWATIGPRDGLAEALEVIGHTAPAPGLPMITALGRDPVPLRRAIAQAIAQMSDADRALLGLRRLVDIPDAEYLAQPSPPPP